MTVVLGRLKPYKVQRYILVTFFQIFCFYDILYMCLEFEKFIARLYRLLLFHFSYHHFSIFTICLHARHASKGVVVFSSVCLSVVCRSVQNLKNC